MTSPQACIPTVFISQKKVFTHFTRTASKAKSEEDLESLTILGATVVTSPLIKILGVLLDEKLTHKVHAAFSIGET